MSGHREIRRHTFAQRMLLLGVALPLFFAGCNADDSTTGDTGQGGEQQDAPSEVSLSEELEGRWRVQSVEMRGETAPDDPQMPDGVEIQNGTFTVLIGGEPIDEESQVRMRIDDSTTPHEMDLERERDGETETLPCIFDLTVEELKIAMPLTPGADNDPSEPFVRPDGFDTSSGEFLVMTLVKDE